MPVTAAELLEVVPYVWDCVLGQALTPAAREADCGDRDRLLAVISISGAWTGDVVLESSLAVARSAAAQMFATPEDALTFDEIQDAFAELTNVVGGNIKSLVPGPSSLGLPGVTSGARFDLRHAFAALLCEASFACDAGDLRVSVWEKIDREALAVGEAASSNGALPR